MKSTEHWLVHDHTQIENLLRHCCDEADIHDWWALARYFTELVRHLRYHLAQEEEVLYRAFDVKRSPEHMTTTALVEQHDRIVSLVRDLNSKIRLKQEEGLKENVEALVDTLLEHNQQEENIFLPFASHLLYDDRETLAQQLEEFTLSAKSRDWGF